MFLFFFNRSVPLSAVSPSGSSAGKTAWTANIQISSGETEHFKVPFQARRLTTQSRPRATRIPKVCDLVFVPEHPRDTFLGDQNYRPSCNFHRRGSPHPGGTDAECVDEPIQSDSERDRQHRQTLRLDLWDTEHNLPRFLVRVCSSLSLPAAVV